MSGVTTDPKELFIVINHTLPNVATFVRTVLKREKLSDEAEFLRARYEESLNALEQGRHPPRPVSFVGDDDSGYFSANRPRGGLTGSELSETQKGPPILLQTGYLLRRDEYRWHRSWCKADSKDMKFCIYEDSNEEVLVRSFSLESTSSQFGLPPMQEIDKDHCFLISGVFDGSSENDGGGSGGDEIYFAAYTETEYRQWKDALHLLTASRESGQSSLSFLDASQGGQDSTSTSSSNFSSNRESMISTASSLLYSYRFSGRSESPTRGRSLDRDHSLMVDDPKALSLSKQQQPLPSPPHVEDGEDGNASDGTIYESIDNLVMQCDETMQATVQAMGQIGQNMKAGRKRKKKERSLIRQPSFFGKSKGHKLKLLTKKKAELEKGEKYCGFLYKRNSSGSWKKKWCVLKGCIFSYFKSTEDAECHEFVVLDAAIHVVKDPKKHHAFCLTCKGLSEMYFAAEDEETFMEWLSHLDTAIKSYDKGELDEGWINWQQEEDVTADVRLPSHVSVETTKWMDANAAVLNAPRPPSDGSVYNVPRMLPVGTTPTGVSPMTVEAAIDSGLYSVPRALMTEEEPHSIVAAQGMQFYPTSNPFDIYDVPRHISISPDEEAIYDDPFDVMDMEIYDYPPDVNDLPWDDSGFDTTDSARNSTITLSSEYAVTDRASQAMSDDSWRTMSLPRFPATARPSSMALSMASSDDYYQSARSSTISTDGLYDYPRSTPIDSSLASIVETPTDSVTDIDISESSLEYSQCTMRGYLLKRERFMQWSKLYCIVRNNFLECHKSQNVSSSGPILKLFLPGSEVTKDTDVRRQWAFKVKHPRREAVLQFAAESEEDYKRWIKAFHSAASIEVQPVRSIEDIRVTDLEMKRRWTSMKKGAASHSTTSIPNGNLQTEENIPEGLPRRNTISHSPGGSDYQSDTLKRKRKFSWISKPGFIRKKNEKKLPSASQPDLDVHRMSNFSFDLQAEQLPSILNPVDPLRRSVSLELLPTESEELSTGPPHSHRTVSPEGAEQFQGYLRVQRRGADSMWVRYWCVLKDLTLSCYISQRDLTLTLSIQLRGSRISEATYECKRNHSFKVWHMESGQCLYFAADDNNEFLSWCKEVTKGAECFIPDDTAGPLSVPYYSFAKDATCALPGSQTSPSRLSSPSSNVSLTALPEDGDNASVSSGTTGRSIESTIQHKGHLKKLSHSGKWKDRYCIIRDCTLYVYRASAEKTPLTTLSLQGCTVQQLKLNLSETQCYSFQVVAAAGKIHTFAVLSEHEMFSWLTSIRDCSHGKPESQDKDTQSQNGVSSDNGSGTQSPALPRHQEKSSVKRRSKGKSKDSHLVSHVAAHTLSNPAHSGFAEVQFGSGPWLKYWCVVHKDRVHIYESRNSEDSVKTIFLPGCEVRCTGPQVNQQLAVSIAHPGVPSVQLTVSDPSEFNQWLHTLEQGSKTESHKQTRPENGQNVLPGALPPKASLRSAPRRGPLKADHSIKAQVVKSKEEPTAYTGNASAAVDMSTSSLTAQRDAIVRRYEKRIRKTRKVASLTEHKLKRQQAAMLHIKRELSRLTIKLQERASKGDVHAQKKLKEVRVKLQQVDKIVPYLSKYIAVNRQAELQTVAILKESCTVDLQKLRGNVKDEQKSAETQKAPCLCANSTSSPNPLDTSQSIPTVTSDSVQNDRSQSVSLSESQVVTSQDEHQASSTTKSSEPESTATPVSTSENSHDIPTPAEPCMTESPVAESPYAELSAVRPAALVSSGSGPSRDYAQLEFCRVTKPSALRPPSVNYAHVDISSLTGVPVLLSRSEGIKSQSSASGVSANDSAVVLGDTHQQSLVGSIEHTDAGDDSKTNCLSSDVLQREYQDNLEDTLTPETNATTSVSSVTPPLSPVSSKAVGGTGSSSTESKCANSVLEAVKQFELSKKAVSPPPVAKKPTARQSTPNHEHRMSDSRFDSSLPLSLHNSTEQDRKQNSTLPTSVKSSTQGSPSRDSGSTKDAVEVTEGTPSVMDRIKALQQQS